jgi:hypothetical protein
MASLRHAIAIPAPAIDYCRHFKHGGWTGMTLTKPPARRL